MSKTNDDDFGGEVMAVMALAGVGLAVALIGAFFIGFLILAAAAVLFYILRFALGLDPKSIRKKEGTDALANGKFGEHVAEAMNKAFADRYGTDAPYLDWRVTDPKFAEGQSAHGYVLCGSSYDELLGRTGHFYGLTASYPNTGVKALDLALYDGEADNPFWQASSAFVGKLCDQLIEREVKLRRKAEKTLGKVRLLAA
ncbi:hypothetical protein GCM10011415_19050 [Salipiger pallidus]|uniref:Uncharacterized protein n=1 Tax=Salipiger pallidus TaxID=1775170 RepID=A0A8J2ZJY4_9RHOB|nr:hypothetical protein [Salipiger pallidus]GGG71392.1 hypothetical protein GCM10011415_19050 [Salipiger pallidus]